MQFINLIKYPAYYHERYKNLDEVLVHNFQTNKINNQILMTATSNDYHITVLFEDNKIKIDSNIKIDCTCESFKYEFSYAVNKANGLAFPDKYKINKRPTKKNIYSYPTGCKHLVKLSRIIYQLKNKI